jgi:hypothetical protein
MKKVAKKERQAQNRRELKLFSGSFLRAIKALLRLY